MHKKPSGLRAFLGQRVKGKRRRAGLKCGLYNFQSISVAAAVDAASARRAAWPQCTARTRACSTWPTSRWRARRGRRMSGPRRAGLVEEAERAGAAGDAARAAQRPDERSRVADWQRRHRPLPAELAAVVQEGGQGGGRAAREPGQARPGRRRGLRCPVLQAQLLRRACLGALWRCCRHSRGAREPASLTCVLASSPMHKVFHSDDGSAEAVM